MESILDSPHLARWKNANKVSTTTFDWQTGDGHARTVREKSHPLGERWYYSPYLTCMECNSVTPVDNASTALRIGKIMRTGDMPEPELLPKCVGCGQTYAFNLGGGDFEEDILESERVLELLRQRRAERVMQVQIAYRGLAGRRRMIRRMYELEARRKMMERMAQRLQNNYRSHVARRILSVKRAVKRIKNAHEIVMSEALQVWNERKVFWYQREAELEMVYKDYRELVRRLGNRPKLHVVENNILEIARRVHVLECRYALKIQRRFRGMIGRKFMFMVRVSTARLLEYHTNCALIIQRYLRSALAKRKLKWLVFLKYQRDIKAKYVKERKDEREHKELSRAQERLTAYYQRDHIEEVAGRLTGKLAFGAENGKRTLAFYKSMYGNERPQRLNVEMVRRAERQMQDLKVKAAERHERKLFLLKMFDTHKMYRQYYNDEMDPEEEASFRTHLDVQRRQDIYKADAAAQRAANATTATLEDATATKTVVKSSDMSERPLTTASMNTSKPSQRLTQSR